MISRELGIVDGNVDRTLRILESLNLCLEVDDLLTEVLDLHVLVVENFLSLNFNIVILDLDEFLESLLELDGGTVRSVSCIVFKMLLDTVGPFLDLMLESDDSLSKSNLLSLTFLLEVGDLFLVSISLIFLLSVDVLHVFLEEVLDFVNKLLIHLFHFVTNFLDAIHRIGKWSLDSIFATI